MNWLLLVAAFPLIWRFLGGMLPAQLVEPYAYWDAGKLNTADASGRVPRWRNMGYWSGAEGETFTQANEALAVRLLDFAHAKPDGHTLDMAHGAGESLLIHIKAGVSELDALTSLPSETAEAAALVDKWAAASGAAPTVHFFTASGGYRPTKDLEHPLNPMRGYMGEEKADGNGKDSDAFGWNQVFFGAPEDEDEDKDKDDRDDKDKDDKEDKEDTLEEEVEEISAPEHPPSAEPANPYDLVYVLDAAYHFPPGIGYFVASVLPVLRPGSGVLAYTDVLPPAAFSKLPLLLTAGWLAPFLHVPRRNINERPASLDQYAAQLEKVGYEHVQIEDWTDHVFVPLADNLEKRGAVWWAYAQVLRFAQRTGWKFVAVRASRPALHAASA